MAKTNPNGANQYKLDPRQSLFVAYYLDPKSKTFSNAYQSALLAGYEKNYATDVLGRMPIWLQEKVADQKSSAMLQKAERNLDELLDLPGKVQAMGAFGPLFEKKGKKKVPILVHATGLLKVKADVSKFVAERVGKNTYGEDADPNRSITQNFIQINIHKPDGWKDAGHKTEPKAVRSLASVAKS